MESDFDELARRFSRIHLVDYPEEFECEQIVKRGTFAKIYKMRNKIDLKYYVLKVACTNEITKRQADQFMGELFMLSRLHHMNVVRLQTYWTYDKELTILLPFFNYGSCADIMQNLFPTGLTESAMGLILTHVLAALEYLHKQNIVHRCIKASHILVNKFGMAVLSGFKFAISFAEEDKEDHKTDLTDMVKYFNWLSPEMMDNAVYSYNTDVYSLGITILELCNGVVPFNRMPFEAMIVQKLMFSAPTLWDINNLPSRQNMPGEPCTSKQAIQFYNEKQEEDMIGAYQEAAKMDNAYKQKCYTKEFQCFVQLCLISQRLFRASVDDLIEHTFMEPYFNLGPDDLIRSLRLNEGVQFKPYVTGAQHEFSKLF